MSFGSLMLDELTLLTDLDELLCFLKASSPLAFKLWLLLLLLPAKI